MPARMGTGHPDGKLRVSSPGKTGTGQRVQAVETNIDPRIDQNRVNNLEPAAQGQATV